MSAALGVSAEWYAARMGWPVFPVKPGDKLPLTANGFHDATRDPAMIARWWAKWPQANIGVPTGVRSGFFAVDVDDRHGGDDSLAKLELQHDDLPETTTAITQGGGRHHLFAMTKGVEVRNRVGFVPGCDIRGDGGYIVVAPSVGPLGSYRWADRLGPHQLKPAAAPEWLLKLIVRRSDGEATPVEEWRALVANGVGEGQRNEAIARLAGRWLRKGIDPYEVLDVLLAWNLARCRPPLRGDEVSGIVRSIAGIEARRRGRA